MTLKKGNPDRACFSRQFIALYLVELLLLSSFVGVFGFEADEAAAEEEYDMSHVVGMWSFDEDGGDTTYDSSGNDNTGTIQGGENWTAGVNGSALIFDGKDDYVEVGDDDGIFNISEKITLEAWINPHDLNGIQSILNKGEYVLGDTDGTNETFTMRLVDDEIQVSIPTGPNHDNEATTQNADLTPNKWYHVAVTYDGLNIRIYLDGKKLLDESPSSGDINPSWCPVEIGKQDKDNNYYFNGTIDEVAIHNQSLEPNQFYGLWSVYPAATIDSISPNPALFNQIITFNGTGTYSRNITNYVWTSSIDGEFHNDTTANFTTNILSLGPHTITFNILTETGRWSEEDTAYLNVTERPVAEIDLITPSPALEGQLVKFFYNGTDDGSIVRYVWYSELIYEEIYNGTANSFTRDDLASGNHNLFFRVQDNHGFWSENATTDLVITGKPTAEILSISPSPALLGETVGFEGRGVDDGDIVGYEWRSDKEGVLSTAPSFSKSDLSLATHTITFRVLDDEGFWSDEVSETLVLHEEPVAVIDSIAPVLALDTEAVHFQGHGIDDGTIIRYVWHSSIDEEFYNDTETEFDYSALSVGEHIISLKVQDYYGVWSDEVQHVETLVVHTKPTAQILVEPRPALLNETILFNATFTDDGSITTYSWRIENETGSEIYNTTERNFTRNNLSRGSYMVYLKILDNHGFWSDEVNKTLKVHEKPVASIVQITPNPARDNDEIQFMGSGTDDGTIVRYEWKIDGEQVYEGENPGFSRSNLSAGVHTVSLSVRDDLGAWSDEVSELLYINEAPVAYIDSIYPLPGVMKKPLYFNGHGTGNGLDGTTGHDKIQRYVWISDMDGELYNGTRMSFNISTLSNKTHNISFVVQDELGLWSPPAYFKIEVNKKPEAIAAFIQLGENLTKVTNLTKINEDDKLKFIASASADGDIARYVWVSSIDGEIYNGSSPAVLLTLSHGNHTIWLMVMDEYGVWSGKGRYDTSVVVTVKGDEDDEPLVAIPGIEDFSLPILERLTNLCLLIILLYIVLAVTKHRRKGRRTKTGGEKQ